MSRNDLTAEMAREALIYEPDTGLLRWRARRPHTKHAPGDVAGSRTGAGYGQVWIGKYNYAAHRLAWLITYGKWPEKFIDHINGDRGDNRIANLREVTHDINCQNLRRASVDSKIQLLGVDSDRPGRYRAKIVVNGKPKYLGRFKTPEEAHLVYLEAKRALHPGCTL